MPPDSIVTSVAVRIVAQFVNVIVRPVMSKEASDAVELVSLMLLPTAVMTTTSPFDGMPPLQLPALNQSLSEAPVQLQITARETDAPSRTSDAVVSQYLCILDTIQNIAYGNQRRESTAQRECVRGNGLRVKRLGVQDPG